MKSIKIFFLAAIAIVAGLFTACSDDKFEGGPDVGGAQVYFPESTATTFSISDDVTSIAIPVNRIVKDEALTTTVLSSDENESGLFTIPSTVTFAAGKETAELLITFDRAKLVDGMEYPLSILLTDENNTTPYGNRSIKITVAPWPWESLGKGKFREGWLGDVFEGNLFEIEVDIHKHKSKEGIYMVEQMLGWSYLTEFFGATKEELSAQFGYNPSNIVLDCSDPSKVTIAKQWSGITENKNGYGKFMFASIAPGKLEKGIITFPIAGLEAELVGLGRKFATNNAGTFRIILPGFKAVDYSLSAVYGGMKVGADNETTSAIINFGYGNDVTGISYVFVAGDATANADKIAAEIVAGTAKNVYELKDFVKGSKKVSIDAEIKASGLYTIIALPKDDTGKLLATEVSAASFYFPGTGGPAPECDINATLSKVSEYPPAADLVSQFPDYYSIAYEISGAELASVKAFAGTTKFVDDIEEYYETTLQKFMESNGKDILDKELAEINDKGKTWNIYINLETNTSYTLVVFAKNIYGKTKVFKTNPFLTPLMPYSGTLAIGDYYMTSTRGENTFKNTFSVKPTPGSTTKFRVADLGYADDERRVATYDPTAETLTLDGVVVGREKDGNLFSKITTYLDAQRTLAYGFFSFATEDSETGNDPLVFTVDPATKQLSKLNNHLEIPVVTVADMKIIGMLGIYPNNTPVTRPSSPSPAKAKAQSVRPVNILLSSIQVPTNTKSGLSKNLRVATAETAKRSYSSDNVIRTLNVKTAKCEPLPMQAGRRANFKVNENLQVMQ